MFARARLLLLAAVLALTTTALLATTVACSNAGKETPATENPAAPGEPAESEGALAQLEGYPEDIAPLYEVKLLDTVYYSSIDDPVWGGGRQNYYHSVWESNVPWEEVRDHYRELCDTIDEEDSNDEIVVGYIGDYKIWLNTGFHNDKNMAYLSVYLPKEQVVNENKFYADFPADIVELPDALSAYEEKYYHTLVRPYDTYYESQLRALDANGDQKPDINGAGVMDFYEAKYKDAEEFTIDRATNTVTWKDGVYEVLVVYQDEYGTGVLSVGFNR